MPEPDGGSRPDLLAELVASATKRELVEDGPDKSGAVLERLEIDGEAYVLKHLDVASDWTMRASGSLRGAPLELWARGILDRLPDCINQPIVAAGREERPGHRPPRRVRRADA